MNGDLSFPYFFADGYYPGLDGILRRGSSCLNVHVCKRGSCHGAGSSEIFAFCNPCCSQEDPSSPKRNVTHSLCLSEDSMAPSPLPVRHHLHKSIISFLQFLMKWFLCGVSAILGAHPDRSIHNLMAPVFTLSHLLLLEQFFPQPAWIFCSQQRLALTLPLIQLGLGWGFSRGRENDLVLVMAQCQVE